MRRREDKIDPIRSKFGNIEKEEIDLSAKTEYIKMYLWTGRKVSFRELLEKQGSKMEVIVTFLIVLELIKIGLVRIKQDDLFDDIIIKVANVTMEEFMGAEIGEENGES
jgi:segregation and condensation protein A